MSRVGCGPQETFRGCSDIAISNGATGTDSSVPVGVPARKPWKTTEEPSTKPGTTFRYKPKTTPKWHKATHKWYNKPQHKKPVSPKAKYPTSPKYWTKSTWSTTPKPSTYSSTPGLEKEEGPLPMTPPRTKMHGHYPEPTTVRPTRHTEAMTPRMSFPTTPRTRFTPLLKSVTGWVATTKKPTAAPGTATTSTTRTTSKPEAENEIPSKSTPRRFCSPVGVYAGSRKMQQWCDLNCLQAPYYCPRTHCKCA